MKITKYFLCVLTIVICNSAIAAENTKITICHNPGNDGGNTIVVSAAAVPSHVEKHSDYVGQCEVLGNPEEYLGTPDLIEFDTATLVNIVAVTVSTAWLTDPSISLDIEITGLNGGYVHHGVDLIDIVNTTAWAIYGATALTVVDWTADIEPRHVNEIYTVCIQLLRDTTELFGPEKCTDFGPF
jgi:hypothetical protein